MKAKGYLIVDKQSNCQMVTEDRPDTYNSDEGISQEIKPQHTIVLNPKRDRSSSRASQQVDQVRRLRLGSQRFVDRR